MGGGAYAAHPRNVPPDSGRLGHGALRAYTDTTVNHFKNFTCSCMSTNRTEIRNAEEIAIAFATAVSENSDDQQDFIAKKGQDSMFAVFHEIFPQANPCSQRVKKIWGLRIGM